MTRPRTASTSRRRAGRSVTGAARSGKAEVRSPIMRRECTRASPDRRVGGSAVAGATQARDRRRGDHRGDHRGDGGATTWRRRGGKGVRGHAGRVVGCRRAASCTTHWVVPRKSGPGSARQQPRTPPVISMRRARRKIFSKSLFRIPDPLYRSAAEVQEGSNRGTSAIDEAVPGPVGHGDMVQRPLETGRHRPLCGVCARAFCVRS
jgi:hypothetical protein